MHLFTSTLLAAGLRAQGHNWSVSTAALAAGVLVDGDHFLDMLMQRLAPRRFALERPSRLLLLLHSWELALLLLLLAGRQSSCQPLLLGLASGYGVHLAIDQYTNKPCSPLTYWLLYRAARGFRGPFFPANANQLWVKASLLDLWRWL